MNIRTQLRIKTISILLLLVFSFSCQKKVSDIILSPNDYFNAVEKVTQTMVHDIFSPPVASRIYAYPNVAAYEIIALQNDNYNSLKNQLNDLTEIPKPTNTINYQISALVAHMELSKNLLFTEENVINLRDSLYSNWESKNAQLFEDSKNYGLEVAKHISKWIDSDNYKQTRTMPKFTVDSDDISRWRPTPPAYMDGIEPHWSKIRPFVITSAAQFKPTPPPNFSLEKESDFYKELKEVYDIRNMAFEKGDDSEEVKIAQFWDCNPYVSVTKGHVMFATKKITPGAHWIGITKIACRKADYDFDSTVYALTKTSIAIADAFISCWDEKYRSNLVRPETLINEYMDDEWEPILQTPPFPEYTSGHSVVSGSAATVLTAIFGDNFQFDDDTEIPYGLPIRSFNSFNEAAEEAAISRMYGGIHYRAAVDIGLKQGKELGEFHVENIKMKND